MNTFAQDYSTIDVSEKYTSYFELPRETLFVHTNKTTYLKGEEIWFKGYAFDRSNNKPSKATSNIYVGVYDATGKQLHKKLFLAYNGLTYGSFKIDSTFTAGNYYVKANTNWMKNFNEDDAFIQKITVLGEEFNQKKKENTTEYDIQFLPEGGHLVANTKNSIGVKMINAAGKGVGGTGIIYDTQKNRVATFKSNFLGIAKFSLAHEASQQYTAEITLTNGEIITKKLPIAENNGIALAINNTISDNVIISLHTNAQTLPTIAGKQYKLRIHKNGRIKFIPVVFKDRQEINIRITKKDLYKGINTVTIFDEKNTPILERLFFNDQDFKTASVNISKLNTIGDSIIFSITPIRDQQTTDVNLNLSVSMLPGKNTSYNPNHNIGSALYLKPYVKGAIENAAYYFTKQDRKKRYELDNLLITQGWSRYAWKDIFYQKKQTINSFENGLTLNGTVNFPANKVDTLFVYNTQNHGIQLVPVKDNRFTIKNFFPMEGEQLRFSYFDKKGNTKNPKLYLRLFPKTTKDAISQEIITNNQIDINRNTFKYVPNNFIVDDVEELDAVILVANKKQKKRDKTRYRFNDNVIKITDDNIRLHRRITDVIGSKGYNVYKTIRGDLRIDTRVPIRNSTVSPMIMLDDIILSDFNFLQGLNTTEVEEISFNKSGLGYGIRAAGGVIKIYTRKTLSSSKTKWSDPYYKETTPIGFTIAKKFYQPKYVSQTNDIFEQFGTITWQPNVVLSKDKQSYVFKVLKGKTDAVAVFVEGISENGSFISEQKTISLKKGN